MADIEALYAQWLDARTTELQQAAQALLHADDPEAAFRAALNEPAEPTTDVLETFADRIKPEGQPDGPYIPELGRRISAAVTGEYWTPITATRLSDGAEVGATEPGEAGESFLLNLPDGVGQVRARISTAWTTASPLVTLAGIS